MRGRIHYTSSAGQNVAYQVIGDGPLDIVVVLPMVMSMASFEQMQEHFVERLTTFARVLLFDPRGVGMSDPLPPGDFPPVGEWSEDIGAVMGAASSERAALIACPGSGHFTVAFAATHAERVSRLVLIHSHVRGAYAPDYPWGWTDDQVRQRVRDIEGGWNISPELEDFVARQGGSDPESYRTMMMRTGSPLFHLAYMKWLVEVDVRDLLPTLTVPTLVLHRTESRIIPVEYARYLAGQIPNARLVELPGAWKTLFGPHNEDVHAEIEEFLTGSRPAPEPQRYLAAVLFTDIVSSTDSKARTGDKRWRELLGEHHRIVRREIKRHGGLEVNCAGDGFLATFDAPLRAIRCAQTIVHKLEPTEMHIRAGIHAGEVERIGDDITGLTVDIGARVAALALSDEVLVSSTVRDMAIGSQIVFEDRGSHSLKGVPGEWRLFAATE